jgi:uncharacterized protein (TIGR01244 family)
MTDFRALTPAFSVAPQLTEADIARAGELGFKTLINNRPDGEAPGQLSSAEARAAAEKAGMAYFEAPFAGPPPPAAVEATIEWLGAAKTPILAYCRSGTRSTTVWALAQAKRKAMPVNEILAAAEGAGYDLSGARPVLEALSKA